MTTYIALLRAVNVAGHNKVAMADLRDLLNRTGFENARSLLQSGNLIFDGERDDTGTIEQILERASRRHLQLETDFFVRTTGDWEGIIDRNPYRAEAQRDPGHLLMMTFKEPPTAANVESLQQAIRGRETLRVFGREGYFVYPDGVGRSRLTNALIEKKLGTRGTARNWNTVLKLAESAG